MAFDAGGGARQRAIDRRLGLENASPPGWDIDPWADPGMLAPHPGLGGAPPVGGPAEAQGIPLGASPSDVPIPGDPRAFGGMIGGWQIANRAATAPGQFIDPSTGGPATFGRGQFLGPNPAFFSAATPDAGSQDIGERVMRIQEAVKRRLEELMQGTFASPNVRRGRFGT